MPDTHNPFHRQTVPAANSQIDRLLARIGDLERENKSLRDEVEKLQARADSSPAARRRPASRK